MIIDGIITESAETSADIKRARFTVGVNVILWPDIDYQCVEAVNGSCCWNPSNEKTES